MTGRIGGDLRTDAELLKSANNDPEAFGVFYRRHFEQLLAFFWLRTRDRQDASELVAETFAAALESLERFDAERGDPAAWLFGIAKNQVRTFWRRKNASDRARRRLEIQTPPVGDLGWESIESADARLDASRLSAALERVPQRNREAVRLRIVEQLEYDDIGDRLDCKPGAARVRVLRGLRRLEQEFERSESESNRLAVDH